MKERSTGHVLDEEHLDRHGIERAPATGVPYNPLDDDVEEDFPTDFGDPERVAGWEEEERERSFT